MRALLVVLLAGCGASAPPLKENGVQAGLQAGMTACDVLRADASIERTPAVDAWCRVLVEGCPK